MTKTYAKLLGPMPPSGQQGPWKSPPIVDSGLSLTIKAEISLILLKIPCNYQPFYVVAVCIVIIARCQREK